MSKTFAAACALWPADQGAISLHDPVRRWIGALPASWSSMTVRQLLTHTSGLCHWDGLGVDLCSAYQRADLIDRITRSQLLFAPGARWSYSSPGFVLVADIVETATGRPYRQVATDQLLRPLGLSHTSVPGIRYSFISLTISFSLVLSLFFYLISIIFVSFITLTT